MPDLADARIEEVTAVDSQGWGLCPFSGGPRRANRASVSYPEPEVVWC
jgi:hypothetical protein